MGGTGVQQQLNISAFNQALAKYQQGLVSREVSKYQTEAETLRRRLDDAHEREMQLRNTNENLRNELHEAELAAANRRVAALEAAAA